MFPSTVFRSMITLSLLMLLINPACLLAQTDSAKAEAPAAEEPSLLSPSIDFVCVQKADNTIDLKTSLKAKYEGGPIKLAHLKVSFLLTNGDETKDLGFVVTDKNGKAVLNVKADSLKTDKDGKLNFKASFAGNKLLEAVDGEVAVKRARLEISAVKEDSVLTVKAKLTDLATGAEKPVPEITIGIFVSRMINPLKIGEGTTDENGEVSVDIPNNLPGDTKGNINLLAKLDESDDYGNLQASIVEPWGKKVSDKVSELPRALWSPHPPIWMLVTFIVLMVVVWGHYVVIVIQMYRLRKEEPHEPQPLAIN